MLSKLKKSLMISTMLCSSIIYADGQDKYNAMSLLADCQSLYFPKKVQQLSEMPVLDLRREGIQIGRCIGFYMGLKHGVEYLAKNKQEKLLSKMKIFEEQSDDHFALHMNMVLEMIYKQDKQKLNHAPEKLIFNFIENELQESKG